MVVVIENPANLTMKNSGFNIGVVGAPDKLIKPVIYSDKETSDKFQRINTEIRNNTKNYGEKKKTPKIISFLYWATGALLVFFGGKNLLKYIKK